MSYNKTFLLIFCHLFLILYGQSQTIEVEGTVSGIWDVDTVLVTGNTVIETNQLLTIESGVYIEFQGYYSLNVDGSIRAVGTHILPVVFTVADTAGFSNDSVTAGGWDGINFNNNTSRDSSVFRHCCFSFGKAHADSLPYNSGGILMIAGSDNIEISHCTFENNRALFNGGAVYLDSSGITISGCLFKNNHAGMVIEPWGYGGAVCSDNSQPFIRNNIFEHNTSTGVGGGVAMRFREGKIDNNIFFNNYSALGGAVGLLHMDKNPYTHCNNLIYENEAEFFGGGIANINASPTYVNNTIAGNGAVYGGGIYCKDSVSPDVINTILWENLAYSGFGNQVYLFEPYSQADFHYSVIQGGIEDFGGSGGAGGFNGNYEHILETDPLFNHNMGGPFSIDPQSPCFNSGMTDTAGLMLPVTDVIGNNRIWDGIIDRGAYEIIAQGIKYNSGEEGIIKILKIYPNPAPGHINVMYLLPCNDHVRCVVSDVMGNQIFGGDETYRKKGIHKEKINFKRTQPNEKKYGYYILTIMNSSGNISMKFLFSSE